MASCSLHRWPGFEGLGSAALSGTEQGQEQEDSSSFEVQTQGMNKLGMFTHHVCPGGSSLGTSSV
jgi:hypothetical protein